MDATGVRTHAGAHGFDPAPDPDVLPVAVEIFHQFFPHTKKMRFEYLAVINVHICGQVIREKELYSSVGLLWSKYKNAPPLLAIRTDMRKYPRPTSRSGFTKYLDVYCSCILQCHLILSVQNMRYLEIGCHLTCIRVAVLFNFSFESPL